ncbi:putative ABC transport system permease protein [Micromonospora pattaloongensis]|uniref:Putative ABC transport system permease protein n=1 Tax=Micromonospora pattaloongensis TaxID=405436 RepID=A0A1H3RSC3_9ACTN|nr:FtsX-like permease family protein [Micromonospora pattaloongensis]SDZ28597.1 putative ABC transport system permease protein [Micromonospora pattaloongensis]
MLKLSLRNLLAHKLRLLLTVAAVTLGVAFVSGTFVLSDTMGKAFDQLYAGLAKGIDVNVRAKAAYTDISTQGQTRPIDESVVETVRQVPGVDAAEGSVTGFALILDKQGKPVQPGGAPTLGASLSADRSVTGAFSFRAGGPATRPDQVVIDAGSAKKVGYRVGDRVKIVFQDSTREFTLVGISGFGDSDSMAGATLASFEKRTAQELLGKVGKIDEVGVRAESGVSAEELRDRIATVLPAGVEAITSQDAADQNAKAVRDGLGIFTTVLLVFAAVSLLVGSFVIWNTFNVLVAQRRREVALLRAVGAVRRQVLGGIVIEAIVVGLVSAALGIGAGVGLAVGIRGLLKAIGIEVPTTTAVVAPRTVVAALLVGVVVTVGAAVIPSWKATRVAPIEALRQATPVTGRIGRARQIAGLVLLLAGAAGLVAAAVAGNQPGLTGLSTLVAFAGLVTAGPLLARGIARLADRGRPGGGWRIAARNVGRAPKRAAATALALTIGLAVVCAVSVTASSTKVSVADSVNGGNRSDLILKPTAAQGGGISPAAAQILRARPDVSTVVEMRFSGAQVNGVNGFVAGVDAAGIAGVADLGIRSGALADFRDGTLLLSTKQAKAIGATVGDTLTVTFPETGATRLRVAATFERESLIGTGYVLTLPDYARHVTSRLDAAILVKAAPGVDRAQVKTAVTAVLSGYPNVKVSDPAELTKDAQASVNQLLGIVTALLLLAVIVAVLGIVNTLVLSVVERTRELGLMRAVGATRRQVRTVVRRESVLMSLLGALAGVALGTGAGVALARSLAAEGITAVSVPVGTLLTYLVVAALVGVLAAIGPARRASRVDVLRAISSE